MSNNRDRQVVEISPMEQKKGEKMSFKRLLSTVNVLRHRCWETSGICRSVLVTRNLEAVEKISMKLREETAPYAFPDVISKKGAVYHDYLE